MPFRVLVADRSALAPALLHAVLQPLGCEFHACRDRRQALAALARETFDAALIDADLTPRAGLEVAREVLRWIRASELNYSIPVVLMTRLAAHEGEPRPEQILQLEPGQGMDLLLAKPFTPESLYSLFHTLRWQMGRARRRHPRLPLRAAVRCRVEGCGPDSPLEAMTLDVSLGGMRLALPASLPELPPTLDLEFALASTAIRCRARVVRREAPGRCGVRFLALPAQTAVRLERQLGHARQAMFA